MSTKRKEELRKFEIWYSTKYKELLKQLLIRLIFKDVHQFYFQ